MLFNTIQFAIFMILVVLAIELFKKNKLQLVILTIASYVFYYFDGGFLVVLLLFTASLDFFCGKKIYESKSAKKKKFFLFISIIGSLGILAFFKYANFTINIANHVADIFGIAPPLKLLNILLPVGISFFTFQSMSYTIDIYRGDLKPASSFLKYMLFIAFFPQLVAGPIVRASDFLPQLNDKRILILGKNLKIGLTYISWGIVKKLIFADNFAPFVNSIFADPMGFSSFYIIIGALAFGIQIYCDFSAYTNIAIGCARIFGFTFLENFNKPYFARNPSDFWRRWHISLSTWLKDYLYIPLGGSRKGKFRTYLNLMITMLLGGLWHGAAWNFVVWGGYQGGLLATHKFVTDRINFKNFFNKFINEKTRNIFSIIIAQYFVFLGWLIFRVRDSSHLLYSIKKFILVDFFSDVSGIISFCIQNKFIIFLILLFFYLHILSYKIKNIIERINSLNLWYWFLYIIFVMLLLFIFTPNLNTAFIYFQF